MATEAKRPSNRCPRQRPRALTKLAHRRCAAPSAWARPSSVEGQRIVVGHQAVGPNGHVRLAHLFAEQVAVDILIAILEEDRLATVSPCGDVVRTIRDDDAGKASHA